MLNITRYKYGFLLFLFLSAKLVSGQAPPASDSTLQHATIDNVISYAISHQPLVKQALLDEEITEAVIKSKLADWYPQINFGYTYQHNFQVPTNVINGNPIRLGVSNTSSGQFTVRQNIFNPDVLLVNRSKDDVRKLAKQNTSYSKIELAAEVAKAFYAVLATQQQIKVAEENIARLQSSMEIAMHQYEAGLADKIDYKRTNISLNNAKADKKANEAYIVSRMQNLKSLMGYPENAPLDIVFDSLQMEKLILLDTTQTLDYNTRIEYQLLQTQRRLSVANQDYYRWSYFPTLSANGAYNFNYQNDEFSKLYSQNYPNSYAGLSLSFPIFQGFKRVANNKQAALETKKVDWDIINFKNEANASYQQALSNYKRSLADYLSFKENIMLAQDVYDVVQLQYKSGIKSYIEVILSEAELRTARISYINAIYLVLSAKIDVEKELGILKY
jgi:outer membrane protein